MNYILRTCERVTDKTTAVYAMELISIKFTKNSELPYVLVNALLIIRLIFYEVIIIRTFCDFNFTKLTRLLLEVPTTHQNCGEFMILFH